MVTIKPDDNAITLTEAGDVVYTGEDGILFFKALQLKMHIKLYMDVGIVPRRRVGIKVMLEEAASIMKKDKPYKIGVSGQKEAHADLDNWCATMRAALPLINKSGE